ncbi:MAG: YggU family protein [Xanthomonadaceae bacterium]|nr:YggU family protein [Xanthomonadaceae bacterium]
MNESVRISVYVQPRASKTAIAGMHDGAIKIRLAAPPVDGAANTALIEFIAERVGVARSRVRLVSGASARRKIVEIEGVDAATVAAALQ